MQLQKTRLTLVFLGGILLTPTLAEAATGRYRATWREDPATTMVIGWDQISGSDPVLYYDVVDRAQQYSAYKYSKRPDVSLIAKGMNNQFARISGLQPNTVYYFVIKDNEGVSRRMSFLTAPDSPTVRLSIIAGGDSRNHREGRLDANRLVSKLRPHIVMFNGDMTAEDTATEWRYWLDDWQATMGSDGRIFPVLVSRGNHESSNKSLVEMFDVKNPDIYYAFNIGGSLLRLYTLNSLIPSGGAQRAWLEQDLKTQGNAVTWRMVQYHHAIRPHTATKAERDELVLNWATYFYKYRVHAAFESDSHMCKWTWPIRPSREPGSEEGFIRDDENGTVYAGEGCWGAPLRDADDNKSWTRNSGSFNQFNWVFVDQYKIEIRTVKTDGADRVREVDHKNVFEPPLGLVLWSPSNGDLVTIKNRKTPQPQAQEEPEADTEELLAARESTEVFDLEAERSGEVVRLGWTTYNESSPMSFELLRSMDGGKQFQSIGKIAGKGKPQNAYTFEDKGIRDDQLLKNVRYRLKCMQSNGKVNYYDPRIEFEDRDDNDWSVFPKVVPDPKDGIVKINYNLEKPADILIVLINPQLKELARLTYNQQAAGPYNKSINLANAPPGRYLLIVKANGKPIAQFRVEK
ncbi:MAG: fibronectin type III domain-containing protein [Saprospiraceae bacterium]|nr:fibronectin type III domain-containing protein [Saprospiraceae bacterium]